MQSVGELFAFKLNQANGPVRVVLPVKGMSISGLKGGSTHDPEGDRALFDAIKKNLRPGIPIIEVDGHVNEKKFVDALLNAFIDTISQTEIKD